jgi:hypothetical protein
MRHLKPVLSRVVHFRPSPSCGLSDAELHHATIVRVLSDSLVNLLVIDGNNGSAVFKQAVRLYQPDEPVTTAAVGGCYCVWPEGVVKFEKSAEEFKNGIEKSGYTLEEVARGDQKRDYEAGTMRAPLSREEEQSLADSQDTGTPAADPSSSAAAPDVETSTTAGQP